MRERFIEKSFKPDTLVTIERANAIIGEYQRQGFTLTLRQLYYQFVARGLIPNKQTEYKRLGAIINDARLAGLIDWQAIEDRTRSLTSPRAWSSPDSIVSAVADQYQEDLWKTQPYRPEMWVEKEALIGVFETICEELRVPHMACRGYASQILLYDAGNRVCRHQRAGYRPIIYHFGDHDPSGIDMTRDNQDRVTMFARSFGVRVVRLALNRDQIDQYNPPPNPAKETDARFASYFTEHGDESWELDALDPTILSGLVNNAIDSIRDDNLWAEAKQEEENHKYLLEQCSERWDDVVAMLEGEN